MSKPYADAAEAYWRAGWPNPIPVRGKGHPATGYTGHDGKNVSWPALKAWRDGPEARHNIALRLPKTVVGIDVDAYDGKVGDVTLASAEAALGPLPAGPRSTSRASSGASGIRFYKVPYGLDLRGAEKRFRARFGDHVDILRHDHRYAVVEPSVHPDTKAAYCWYDENDDECPIPVMDTLPELPAAWCGFLAAPVDVAGASIWDDKDLADYQFTVDRAKGYVEPALEILRSAPNGSINNRLNDAAITFSHFVPAFLSRARATAILLEALDQTEYDGKTWRAEATIESGLGADTWKAEILGERGSQGAESETPMRRGDFAGIRERQRSRPEFLTRDDGRAMLYPGKDTYLYAETESGKSWLAAVAVVQCVSAGVPIMVVDFEEGDEVEYGQRLLALGLSEAQLCDPALFRYLMVDGKATAQIMGEAEDMGARVVINEGMSIAYDVYGLQVKENDSATLFRRLLVKPHLICGRAVLTTDHVVKDRDARGRYAIGGVMKLNAASGGAFLLVNVEGFAPGRRGASALYVTKDRPGEVKRHGVRAGDKFDPQVKRFGTLIVDDSRDSVNYFDVRLAPPAVEDDAPAPTSLAERIFAAIARIRESGREGGITALRAEVGGTATVVDAEVERMLTRGELRERRGIRDMRIFDPVETIME